MERHRRGKGKQKLLGSHQRCWIWGRNAVLETLEAGRWPVLELVLSAELPADRLARAQALAARAGFAARVAPAESLTALCRSSEHQGYAAKMTDFPYAAEAEVVAGLSAAPLCVVLAGVQDPYNFGAIVRSAEVLGVEAVFIGARGQAGVTSMAVRSSAGAVSRVPIVPIEDLEALAARLRGRGLQLVAASEKAAVPIEAVDLRGPTALVIGNEGAGVPAPLLARCGRAVAIPQVGRIGSLNAAVAAAVFFYEALRQRRAAGDSA
jgi:23S rRNA (guanosine2251-2'-O)-methyltransferase